MAVMHRCWSLNKISSPALWIRVVKRFNCNILSSPHVKKNGGESMALRLWYVCYSLTLLLLHSLSNFKVCSNNWNHWGGKSQEQWHTGLTYFSQVWKLSRLASVLPAFSHCQLELTEQNSIVPPDIPPLTVPQPLLIIVWIEDGHPSVFCICIFRNLEQKGLKSIIFL